MTLAFRSTTQHKFGDSVIHVMAYGYKRSQFLLVTLQRTTRIIFSEWSLT